MLVRTEFTHNQQLVKLHGSAAAVDRVLYSSGGLRLPRAFAAEVAACRRVGGVYVTNTRKVTAREVKQNVEALGDLLYAEVLISRRHLTDYTPGRPNTDNAYFLRFAVSASLTVGRAVRALGETSPIEFYYNTHTQNFRRERSHVWRFAVIRSADVPYWDLDENSGATSEGLLVVRQTVSAD